VHKPIIPYYIGTFEAFFIYFGGELGLSPAGGGAWFFALFPLFQLLIFTMSPVCRQTVRERSCPGPVPGAVSKNPGALEYGHLNDLGKRRKKMAKLKLLKNLGMTLLGIWLIMTGLIPLLNLSFEGLPLIMSVMAIVAGVMILFNR